MASVDLLTPATQLKPGGRLGSLLPYDEAPGPGARAVIAEIATLLRRPAFQDIDAARAVCRVHGQPQVWGTSRCLAWVLLPDRWQALLLIGRGDTVERVVRRFKAATTPVVDRRLTINGWLWERGFNQQAVVPGPGLLLAARELIRSPISAGLSTSVATYPYWDSVWITAPGCQRSAACPTAAAATQ